MDGCYAFLSKLRSAGSALFYRTEPGPGSLVSRVRHHETTFSNASLCQAVRPSQKSSERPPTNCCGGTSPLEARRIGTLHRATYLGRSMTADFIAVGKQADFLEIEGNPAAQINDFRTVQTMCKHGVGYDAIASSESVKGMAGWY